MAAPARRRPQPPPARLDPWVRVRRSQIEQMAAYIARHDDHDQLLQIGYQLGREATIGAGYQAGYDLGYDHGTAARQDARQFIHGILDGFGDGAWAARMLTAQMTAAGRPPRQARLPGTEVSKTWVDRA